MGTPTDEQKELVKELEDLTEWIHENSSRLQVWNDCFKAAQFALKMEEMRMARTELMKHLEWINENLRTIKHNKAL